jgi:hypothetical protein
MTSVRPLTEQERVAFGDPTGPTGGRPGFGEDPHGPARCPRLPGQQNRRSLTVHRWLKRFNAGSGTAGLWPADSRARRSWPSAPRSFAWSKRPNRRSDCGRRRRRLFALTWPASLQHRPPAVGASGADAGFVWRRPKLIVRSLARQWAIEAGPETRLLPVVRAMWMRRGQQVRVPTPGTVFGGLDTRSGAWYYRVTERKPATNFVGFLEQRSRPLVIIADNAGVHSARVVQSWLVEHPQVRLPSPFKSCREGLVAANRCYGDISDLVEVVHRFFAELTPQATLRLAA